MMHYYMQSSIFRYWWLWQALIILLFFLIVFWMLKGSGTFGHAVRSQETPLEILKKRLASGEIGQKEFQRIKKDIESD